MNRSVIRPFFALLAAIPGVALAHALPERSLPDPGAVLSQAPDTVAIYFDSELEPGFSRLIVRNARGAKVSVGNGEISTADRKLLAARLSGARKGAYHVYWNVVSHDGHRAQGDYEFTVR